MLRLIQADRYRCLRSVKQEIRAFEVLVGSNASGKSSFLDVISFLRGMVSEGLEAAVSERTTNFHDLVWGRESDRFELAVEAKIPERYRVEVPGQGPADSIRYEIGIRLDTLTEKLHIARERATIYSPISSVAEPGVEVISRTDSVAQFISETKLQKYPWQPHRNYSGLVNLPVDAEFPAATWLRNMLRDRVKPLRLEIGALRQPAPSAQTDQGEMTGSYLVRYIAHLGAIQKVKFNEWLAHLRTVLPDIRDIRTVLREEDKHRYVVIDYQNGVSVPSWVVSDGTLRLMALTLLAYLPVSEWIYLIEEPENGVHPAALQAIFESLSSIYQGQVLIASQSPVLLGMATPEQVLCFAKTPQGTAIVRGSEHEALRDWKGEIDLGVLAASGILG